MGIGNTLKGLRNIWNIASMDSNVPAFDVLKHLDFFSFSGNSCVPEFTINLSSWEGLEEAYYKCPPLSSIIGRNAMAMANAKWWLTDESDNDIKGYDNLKKLLKRPNPLQTWTELILQFDTYRWIYGGAFLLANTSVGFSDNKEAMSIWAVKPTYIEIETSKKLYLQSDIDEIIKGYNLILNGHKTALDRKQVLYIKDSYQNLNFSPLDIKGKSRIEGLEYPIRNICQAYEAIYALNKNRGPQGILSNDTKDASGSLPLIPSEKKDLQRQLMQTYGMRERQATAIITDAAVRWQPMSFSVKDLMLFDGVKNNIEQLSDSFLYPFGLLANDKGPTHSNANEFKKTHYQDNIIPMAGIYSEALTSFFGLDGTGIRLYADFSHIECLQQGEKEKADALKIKADALLPLYRAKVITLEELRTQLDFNEQADGKTYYDGSEEKNKERDSEA